jgi:hypothetical protein
MGRSEAFGKSINKIGEKSLSECFAPLSAAFDYTSQTSSHLRGDVAECFAFKKNWAFLQRNAISFVGASTLGYRLLR